MLNLSLPQPATFPTQADGYESLINALLPILREHECAKFDFTALSDGNGLPVDILREAISEIRFAYGEYAEAIAEIFGNHMHADMVLQGADPRDVLARYEAYERSIDTNPMREAAE